MKALSCILLLPILLMMSCSLDDDRSVRGSGIQLPEGDTAYDNRSLLVKMNSTDSSTNLLKYLPASVSKTIRFGKIKYVVLLLEEWLSVKDALDYLKGKSGYLLAEPNYIHSKSLTPNDPSYNSQYAHALTDTATAWDVSTGSVNVAVAVVDTGVNGLHPDLAPNMIDGYDCVSNTGIDAVSNSDQDGHGTHVAGIAAARGNNGTGVAGVAWNCKIMPVKVLDADGRGTAADVAQGIAWAATNTGGRRMVINLSLGSAGFSQIIQDAVLFAMQQDAVIVAAMGNDSQHKVKYPAYLPGVIGVGATDSSDKLASFSTRGKHISVSAPGADILSTGIGGDYVSMSGTSMATPFVSGLAALLLSKNSSLNAAQLKSILELSAVDLGDAGFDDLYGYGRVNAAAAMAFAATNKFGAILVQTLNPDGPVGDLEVLLCDGNTNVLRSYRTSVGTNISTVSNGSCMLYYIPPGNYVLKASWGTYLKTLPVTVYASNTEANPAVAVFELGYSQSALTLGLWAEGQLSPTSAKAAYFYFDATAGHSYALQWNESGSGTGGYTLNVKASLLHADKATSYFTDVDSGYTTPQYFTAIDTERIWVRIDPKEASGTGTFAVRLTEVNISETGIPTGTWVSNYLYPLDAAFFFIDGEAGKQYIVSWDDANNGSSAYSLNIKLSAYREDKNTVYFTDQDAGFGSNSRLITAAANERIYMRATAYALEQSGSFALRIKQAVAEFFCPLNTWMSNYIDYLESKYYYFNATAGEIYAVQWDESGSGSWLYNLSATASAFRADKTTAYFTEIDNGYSTPRFITAAETDKTYIKISGSSPQFSHGSFGVRVTPVQQTNIFVGFSSWTNITITSDQIVYCYFDAIEGQQYAIQWDDLYNGSGTYTLDVVSSAFRLDKSTVYYENQDTAFNSPRTITAAASERIYLRFNSKNLELTGTIGCRVTPIVHSEQSISLNSWHADSMDLLGSDTFYFDAIAGKQYTITVLDKHDSGTYTLNASCNVYHQDKSTQFSDFNDGFLSNQWEIKAMTSERVYVKVTPYATDASGTYAIRIGEVAITESSIPMNTETSNYLGTDQRAFFYFDGIAGKEYAIYQYNTGSYTLKTELNILNADKTTAFVKNIQISPYIFTCSSAGRIYLYVHPSNTTNTGSYGLKVVPNPNPDVPLVMNSWHINAIPADLMFSWTGYFNTTAGHIYAVSWDDSYGSGTYNLSASVAAFHSDKTNSIWGYYSGWWSPQFIEADRTETVYIKIRSEYSFGGSFRVKYQEVYPSAIPANTWRINSFPDSYGDTNPAFLYQFNAVGGRTYAIQWDDTFGSGTYTGWVEVAVFHGDRLTPFFRDAYSGYSYPPTITPSTSETVYILVRSVNSIIGNFAIRYYQQ